MKFLRQHRGEVIPRDPGEARDRASGTAATVAIIPIDLTHNFSACAPVIDHLTMPGTVPSVVRQGQLGYKATMVQRRRRTSSGLGE